MSFIPRDVLMERLDPRAPGADAVRDLIDNAYRLGEAAQAERAALRDARDPLAAEKLKAYVVDRCLPRLTELARPLTSLRQRLEDDRKLGRERSDTAAALGSNLALADGALWTTRRDLAPMAGMRVADLELAAVLSR